MSVKLLTEHHLESLGLKGDCIGSSESTLVKIPHCWKSHVTTHFSTADVNECQTGSHQCTSGGRCVNNPGNYSCECLPGFTGQYCQTGD